MKKQREEKGKLFLKVEVDLINVEVNAGKNYSNNCFRQKSSINRKISRWKYDKKHYIYMILNDTY